MKPDIYLHTDDRIGRIEARQNRHLPAGTFEEPKAPVYVDERLSCTLKGDHIIEEFRTILDDYVESHYRKLEVAEPAGVQNANDVTSGLVV